MLYLSLNRMLRRLHLKGLVIFTLSNLQHTHTVQHLLLKDFLLMNSTRHLFHRWLTARVYLFYVLCMPLCQRQCYNIAVTGLMLLVA